MAVRMARLHSGRIAIETGTPDSRRGEVVTVEDRHRINGGGMSTPGSRWRLTRRVVAGTDLWYAVRLTPTPSESAR